MATGAELALLFTADTSAVDKAVDDVSKSSGGLMSKLGGLAGPAAAGVAAIGAAGVGAAAALVGVGMKFDDAFDTMAVQTGATGDALAGLQDSFKNVIGNTPADFETVTAAMGTLAQRTGATGADLEALTTQVADLSRITGTDATAAANSAADIFAKFGTSVADQGPLLDQLFVASQQSGVAFDQLAGSVAQFSPQLEAMGLGAKDGAALIATMAKSGIDASAVMPGLSKAIGNMVKDGVDPIAGLSTAFDKIKSEGANSATAMEMFGKSGLTMAQAISSGAMDMNGLIAAMGDATGTISETAKSTADFGETWDMIKNKALVALEPMGTALMGLATTGMEMLMPMVDRLSSAFSDLADGDIVAMLNDLGLSMDSATKYGEPIMALFEELKTVFADSGGGVDGVVGMFDLLLEKFGLISAGDFGQYFTSIRDAIASIDWAGILASLQPFIDALMNGLGVVLPIIGKILTDVLWPILSTVFGFIADNIGTIAALGAAFLVLTNPIAAVIAAIMAIGVVVPWIKETFGEIGDWIAAKWNEITGWISAAVDMASAYIMVVWQAIKDYLTAKLTEIGDNIAATWTAIKDSITERIEAARVMISAKWDAIKEYLTAKLEQIKAAVAVVWDAVKQKVDDAMAAVQAKIDEAWSWVGQKIDDALAFIQGLVGKALDWIEQKTGVNMDSVRGIFDTAMTFLRGLVQAAIDFITGHWDEGLAKLEAIASMAWAAVKKAFSDAWEGLKKILDIDALVANFRAGMGAFSKIGGDLIEGLKTGVSNAWDTFMGWLKSKLLGMVDAIKGWFTIHSPSKLMADEIGEPLGMGIAEGMKTALANNSLGELVRDWATLKGPGFVAKLITPIIGSAIGIAIGTVAARSVSAAAAPPELVSSAGKWGVVGKDALGYGLGPMKPTGSPDDGRVRADAFRSGKGGLLAASKSNYWQVFVQKWGVPTEESARKVAQQLGIPIPDWLEQIYHPDTSASTVDRPDVLKDPAAAAEYSDAIGQLATASRDAAEAVRGLGKAVVVPLDALRATLPSVEQIIRRLDGAVKLLPSPGGPGIGGPIPIPGPGGVTTFGTGGGGASIGAASLTAQTVAFNGPLNLGINATMNIGGGRTLTATLVDALITDTASFDKLIKAEDGRRASKS